MSADFCSLFSIGSKFQWGKEDCYSKNPFKRYYHSMAVKASVDTRVGDCPLVVLAAPESPPVSSSCYYFYIVVFCC